MVKKVFFVFAVFLIFSCSRKEGELQTLDPVAEAEVLALSDPEIEEEEIPVDSEPESSAVSSGNRYIMDFPQLSGSFSGPGVNLAELNPANYQLINREAMEGMGMSPWYVAYLAGQKLYQEGNNAGAIDELNRAISLNADYANAYVYRGNAQRKMGNLGRALDDFNRALTLDNSYAEVYNYRGFVQAQRGELRLAVADYTQAIRYRADYADAYFNRAHAHAKLGNWDLSINDYTQVIRLEPDNAIAYNERGHAWFDYGNKANAARDYEAADRLLMRGRD